MNTFVFPQCLSYDLTNIWKKTKYAANFSGELLLILYKNGPLSATFVLLYLLRTKSNRKIGIFLMIENNF